MSLTTQPMASLALLAMLAGCGGGSAAAPVAPAPPTVPAVVWTTPPVSAPRVQYRTFPSTIARATVSYHVYTPPQYDNEAARRFPVLYWLHGSGGGLGGISVLSAYFDNAIGAGRIPPMLVVFPNGMASSMWADSKDGRVPMESMVVRDLVPHVDATFRTVAARDGRLLEGFSMGGLGASRWGLRYPDVFGAMSMFAAGPLDLDFNGPRATGNPAERAQILRDVYSDDMTYYVAQNPFTVAEQYAAAIRGTPRALMHFRQVVGSLDFTLPANEEFRAHVTRLAIVQEYTLVPNVGHDTMALLEALGDRNFAFYRAVFGAR
jgi:pimeloyl-ACP methyl ester carboxylesterase